MINIENRKFSSMDSINSDKENFFILKRWLENKNVGKTFAEYFQQCGYETIAIYGVGDLGRLLYEEIKNSKIRIKYFVDRNGEGIHEIDGIPVIILKQIDEMEAVDILVVTVPQIYDMVAKILAQHVPKISTLSLQEAVCEV